MQILVASNGSPSAERAVDFAAHVARFLNAELTILTVSSDIISDKLRRMSQIEREAPCEIIATEAKSKLSRARRLAEDAGVSNAHTRAESGDSVETILEVAKASQSDLIVVGKGQHEQWADRIKSSTSQKVVRSSRCPVVVVP